MRIWSLHPQYLDTRGLTALWREALLAQAVLKGQTRGYNNHPQLIRFRETPAPLDWVANYLCSVHGEAKRRGYNFDASKIADCTNVALLTVTEGQLDYEWTHLRNKLQLRAPHLLAHVQSLARPQTHPLFRVVPGGVADWEIVTSRKQPAKAL
ncbi:MAG TPA: pyrimidine dimer DNA glycosylase/endonuclease V [Methylophilaceae bacterium]|nr:pyrimidine dimer DNA glycosylase/endonuclease V [Methylophilaceae bacterium]